MKLSKFLLLAVVVSAVVFLVSCKDTPAEEIENTTMALEKEAENAEKQAEDVSGSETQK